MQVFSQVTRIVKFWAKRKGIYSFNFGYLNGISIMIMVVRAMQDMKFLIALDIIIKYSRNNNHSATKKLTQILIYQFFALYANWPWYSRCGDLNKIVYITSVQQSGIAFEEELQEAAGYNVMPIISPYHPFRCTTNNMTASALRKVYLEIQAANINLSQVKVYQDNFVKLKQPWSFLFTHDTSTPKS